MTYIDNKIFHDINKVGNYDYDLFHLQLNYAIYLYFNFVINKHNKYPYLAIPKLCLANSLSLDRVLPDL